MNNIDEILENLAINQKKSIPDLNYFEKQRVLTDTIDRINSKKSARHSTFRRTAIICAICVTFVTSVAAAGFFRLDEIFYNFLHGSDTNVQVSGEDIAAQDTSNGVTVTAKQIIGDDYGFYVIFYTGKNNNITVNRAEVEIKGAEVYQCSDIIGMEGGILNTFMLHIMSAENLQGRQIAVRLSDKNGSTWDLNWKISYSNSAKNFDVSKPIRIYGGSALWKSVSISPVSVTVRLTDLRNTKTNCSNPNDTITVTMDDGSVFSSDSSIDTDILHDTDFITMSFNKIIDIGKVKSISFAGEVYIMN